MKKTAMLIENVWLCPFIAGEVIPLFGDITISGGVISKIKAKNFQTYLKNPEKVQKNSFNARGRVMTLPLVNFHDHIYSRLAKGLPLTGDFGNFQNVLHNLWWKLDRALDKDMITASAQMAAMESIRNGVTYIFDHHSSQNKISGSLTTIKNTLHEFGLRGVLCFESTDRNGTEKAMAGLSENKNFFTSQLNGDFHGMLGLHASFTLSNDLLREAHLVQNQFDLGIHIHVAEDDSDNKLSVEFTGKKPIRRLRSFKLINSKSILVHGVHLSKNDFIKISEVDGALAFCPDSNLNNSVGLPQFGEIPKSISFLTGTDGMHSNVARSMKQLFLLARGQENSFDDSTALIKKIYSDQITFAKRYFHDFPLLQQGERADMVLWDYVPPTPLKKDNFWGHYIYGILEYPVHSVLQNGEFLMKEFKFVDVNESKIKNDVYLQGERLAHKMMNMK
ncbi:MAG: hypothetical protein CVV24_12810 [Ignavibacteriae bacterium HGW-Ignavibacteriae-3]|nr:MAG: hypothetical protein CVV24_12810 [Ignavibacteriae bacterium HGW-Ignavibacteriae-3]